jgi:hypothetical protein
LTEAKLEKSINMKLYRIYQILRILMYLFVILINSTSLFVIIYVYLQFAIFLEPIYILFQENVNIGIYLLYTFLTLYFFTNIFIQTAVYLLTNHIRLSFSATVDLQKIILKIAIVGTVISATIHLIASVTVIEIPFITTSYIYGYYISLIIFFYIIWLYIFASGVSTDLDNFIAISKLKNTIKPFIIKVITFYLFAYFVGGIIFGVFLLSHFYYPTSFTEFVVAELDILINASFLFPGPLVYLLGSITFDTKGNSDFHQFKILKTIFSGDCEFFDIEKLKEANLITESNGKYHSKVWFLAWRLNHIHSNKL